MEYYYLYLAVWAGGSLLVGLLAAGCGRSVASWFVISLIISPLLGLAALLITNEAAGSPGRKRRGPSRIPKPGRARR